MATKLNIEGHLKKNFQPLYKPIKKVSLKRIAYFTLMMIIKFLLIFEMEGFFLLKLSLIKLRDNLLFLDFMDIIVFGLLTSLLSFSQNYCIFSCGREICGRN